MKILLVGGCGFIGFNVFKYLKTKKKNDILIIDNLSGQSSKKNLQNLRKSYHDRFIYSAQLIKTKYSILVNDDEFFFLPQ